MTERERLEALKLLTDLQWKELRLELGRANAAQLPEVGVSADRALELTKLLATRPMWIPTVDDYLLGAGLGPAPWKPWMDGLAEEYGRIPLIGFSAHRDLVQMPANALFLELSLLKEKVDPKGRRLDVEDRKPLSIEDACRRLGGQDWGLAIVGRPGSGKTTLLRRIFTRCWREGSETVGLPPGLIPVYLRIGSAAPDLLVRPIHQRRGRLKELLLREVGAHHPAAEALLQPTRPLLFLLDGLDEVGTDAQRLEICAWLIKEIPDWRPNARVILSCRLAAWEQAGPALRSRLQPLEVRDLALEQVLHYVSTWFTAVTPEIAKRRGGAQQALEARLKAPQSRTDHSLLALARTPLLLSIVCLVHHFYGLPERRVELYQRAVEILLRDHALHQERPECALSEGELRRLLQVLAWAMQCQESAEAVVELAREDALALIAEAEPPLPATEALRLIEEETGLLISPRLGFLSFAHLSFQEYLAARQAKLLRQETWLTQRFAEPRWEEVIALALADEELSGFLLPELLKLELEGHIDRAWRWLEEAHRPAGHLRKVLRPETQPGTLRLVATWFHRHPDPVAVPWMEKLRDHADAGIRAIARAKDPPRPWDGEPEPGERRALVLDGVEVEFVWVPPGEFWMGAQKKNAEAQNFDTSAFDHESPVHRVKLSQGYWLGRFPVTEGQWGRWMGGREEKNGVPATRKRWYDAVDCCRHLSRKLQTTHPGWQVDCPRRRSGSGRRGGGRHENTLGEREIQIGPWRALSRTTGRRIDPWGYDRRVPAPLGRRSRAVRSGSGARIITERTRNRIAWIRADFR